MDIETKQHSPDGLKFEMPESVSGFQRKRFRINPTQNLSSWSYQNNRKIKFYLPTTGFLDCRSSTVTFKAGDNGSGAVFNQFIESIFQEVMWRLGDGKEIERVRNYNLLACSKAKFEISRGYAESIGKNLQGIDSLAQRTLNSSRGIRYAVNLLGSDFFQSQRYIPLGLLYRAFGSFPLSLEIELESPAICMTGAGADYTVSDVYMNVEVIESPEFEQQWIDRLKGGESVYIPYKAHLNYQNTLEAGRTGEVVYQIPDNHISVKGVRSMFLPSTGGTDIDRTNTYSRPLPASLDGGLMNYQYKVGTEYFPTNQVEIGGKYQTATAFLELVKYIGEDRLRDGCCGVNTHGSSVDTPYEHSYARATGPLLDTDQPAGKVQIALTAITQNQTGYSLSGGGFQVPDSGRYEIIFNCDPQYASNNGALVPNSNWTFTLESGGVLDTHEIRLTNLGATDLEKINLVMSTILNLTAGSVYTFHVTPTGSANSRLFVFEPQVNLKYLDALEVSVADDPLYTSSDFMIAQSFDDFYEQDDMSEPWQYVVSGRDTMRNSIDFRFKLSAPDAESYAIMHFTDFDSVLKITDKRVDVIN